MSSVTVPLPASLDSTSVVRMWLARAYARSHSDATVRAYTAAVQAFERWQGGDLLACTRVEALRYAEHLGAGDLAPASVARDLSALRSLYAFAVALGVIEHSPFAIVRGPKVSNERADRMVPRDVVRQMLAACNPRQRALLLLLSVTGLRVSEACAARWSDTFETPDGDTGLLVRGKGNKQRRVKLPRLLLDALAPWRTPNGPLWPARHGDSTTPQSVDAMLDRIAKRAGVQHVSAHMLRHFLATQALAAGAPLLQVQQDLGHASVRTTQRYLHMVEGLRRTSADYVAEGL